MKFIYLGGFPPPYGGVTVKNKLLFKKLNSNLEIKKSGFYNHHKNIVYRVIALLLELINKNNSLVIGVSKGSLKILTYILYYLNKKVMNNSIVMVMGGTFHHMVLKDKKLQKFLKEYKKIYIETDGMKKALNSVGISNVTVFPNCRERADISINLNENPKIRCLFFSQVSLEKGVDNVLDMAGILDNKGVAYSIDFYGEIVSEYKMIFESTIDSNSNIHYCGVYKSSTNNDLYEKLSHYDVLLFPTRWKNEGVPGVLVESKISGLPSIVSDLNFNSEIIEDESTGIVLKQNTPEELANVIERLYLNRDLLAEMKHKAKASSEYFIIENYIEEIIQCLTNNDQ
ncbi:sugar transferase, PEP-CTERM/EpsH1 system associated [Oceanobacillus picturae]|uniref:Sugar transferase, PEP-CTERM/EpsH1 system associated n=1 Tax=Oceanobacillus picturae TaxID=171693 RepID=W9ADX6_9BACI|nr:glycosyltransferase [Oceanobacillus picturae]CDO03673.1 sugar transferase, PEP-CTERM/EpsH1 system associated [Oceanobacillus picturae]